MENSLLDLQIYSPLEHQIPASDFSEGIKTQSIKLCDIDWLKSPDGSFKKTSYFIHKDFSLKTEVFCFGAYINLQSRKLSRYFLAQTSPLAQVCRDLGSDSLSKLATFQCWHGFVILEMQYCMSGFHLCLAIKGCNSFKGTLEQIPCTHFFSSLFQYPVGTPELFLIFFQSQEAK